MDERATQSGVLSYGMFDYVLNVFSESPDLAAHVNIFMKNLHKSPDAGDSIVRMAIFAGSADKVMVCRPDIDASLSVSSLGAGWIAFRQILNQLLLRSTEKMHDRIHGASMARSNGATLVISGDQGSGKTTMSVAMAERGLMPVCDDFTAISRQTGLIEPLPLGCTFDEGTFSRFPNLLCLQHDEYKFWSEEKWQWTVNLSDRYPIASIQQNPRPTHFFFLTPDHGHESCIMECGQVEAITRYLESRVIPSYEKRSAKQHGSVWDHRLALIQRLIRETRFFHVVNGCIEQTADMIYAASSEMG